MNTKEKLRRLKGAQKKAVKKKEAAREFLVIDLTDSTDVDGEACQASEVKTAVTEDTDGVGILGFVWTGNEDEGDKGSSPQFIWMKESGFGGLRVNNRYRTDEVFRRIKSYWRGNNSMECNCS